MKICNCQGELKLICKKKTPLYYIFRHICAELDMEIHGCEKCGLRMAKVPEQIFRETKEQKEEYTKEIMKNVSIL